MSFVSTWGLYGITKQGMGAPSINLLTDTIKCALYTGTGTLDRTTRYVSNITGFVECAASGYTRQTLANIALGSTSSGGTDATTPDLTNNRVEMWCDDIAYGVLGTSAAITRAVLYKHTGSDSTSTIIAVIDSGSALPFTPNGVSSYTLDIQAEGLLHFRTA